MRLTTSSLLRLAAEASGVRIRAIETVQKSLTDKSENLPGAGHLDAETAGKLGVGPESTGGNCKGGDR